MAQVQTGMRSRWSSDWLPLPRQHGAVAFDDGDAADPILLRAIVGTGPVEETVGSEIGQAIVGVYHVRDKQRFPSSAKTGAAHVVIAGWAVRSEMLRSGARQITDIIVPGDFYSPAARSDRSPSAIEACGPVRVAVLDLERLSEGARELVADARRKETGEIIRRLRARLVSLGRCNARERLAQLITETHARLADVGLAGSDGFVWPLTQEHLGDILGLTSVHINRTLAQLRSDGLVVVRHRRVLILDPAGLRRAGGLYDVSDEYEDGPYDRLWS